MSRFKINDVVWVDGLLKPGIISSPSSVRDDVPHYRVHCFVAGDWLIRSIPDYELRHYIPRPEVLAEAMDHNHLHIQRAEELILKDECLQEELEGRIERICDQVFLKPTGT